MKQREPEVLRKIQKFSQNLLTSIESSRSKKPNPKDTESVWEVIQMDGTCLLKGERDSEQASILEETWLFGNSDSVYRA